MDRDPRIPDRRQASVRLRDPAVPQGGAAPADRESLADCHAFLSRLERLTPLGRSDRAFVTGLFARSTYAEARRTLQTEARPCDALHVILEGWAIEYRLLSSGARQILKVHLPGEVFGAECLTYGTALQSVQTLTRSRVAAVSRQDWEEMAAEHSRLATAFFLMNLCEGAIANEWALSLGRRPGWARVAHLLLELSERSSLAGLGGPIHPFPLTQQDIADCTGLTIAYVNRALGDLRKRGLIRLQGQELAILDPPEMARYAWFKPHYLHPGQPPPGAPSSSATPQIAKPEEPRPASSPS